MTRAELQNEIHDLQTKAQKTVVFVTHDMDEAIKRPTASAFHSGWKSRPV